MKSLIMQVIAALDRLISRQLDVILHDPRLQRLEASWRSLYYLVEQQGGIQDTRVKIKVLSITWQELSKDLLRAIEFDQSQLFTKIYSHEFGHPGGEPYGLLLGDYQISHRRPQQASGMDMQVLNQLAKVAAAAFAPFVTGVHAALFGVNEFADLARPINFERTFQQAEYHAWKALRQIEDARFIGLLLPQVLVRLPYRKQRAITHPFCYSENVAQPKAKNYLWGSPVYAFAAVVIRAFRQTGWLTDIKGVRQDKLSGGLVPNLPRVSYSAFAADKKYATEVCITDRLEKILSEWGFIALCENKYTELAGFYSCSSIQQPKSYNLAAATENARLSSMLHYVLCVSRFAHYVKVIARDKVGSFAGPLDCENFLQHWLQQYCAASGDLNPELKAKYPLRGAKVEVVEQPGKPGNYLCVVKLSPHMQFEQAETYLQLVTELKGS